MDGEAETAIGKEAWDTLGQVGSKKNLSFKEPNKQGAMNIASGRSIAPERALSALVSRQQAADEGHANITKRQKLRGKQTAVAWALLLHLAVLAIIVIPRFPCAKPASADGPSLQQEHIEEKKDDTVYCETELSQEGATSEQECVTCPQNAECRRGKMECFPGYTPSKKKNGHKESQTVCIEDAEKKAKAAEVMKLLVEILRERQGRYDCGYALDPLFSPSEQLGGKPWSTTITKMCSGPGLNRWQMNFHREIGPAIADEGVYFWLFYHFLTPEAAAKIDIQVERQYLFVPLANPVDFPELHERLMREQGRAKGITFTYTYTGPDTVKPLSCKISQMAHDNLLALLGLLVLLVLCSQVAQHLYSRHYIRKEVLALIRLHTQHGDATSLTRGIPTDILLNLLCERLAKGSSFSRFLIQGRLTVERVDEACHELLWKPETGVHAYRLNETNHWWAERQFPPPSNAQGVERENHPSCWNDTGATVGSTRSLEKPTLTTSKLDSSLHQHSDTGGLHIREDDSGTSQYCNYGYSPPPVPLRDHDTAHVTVNSPPLSTFGQHATFNQNEVATAERTKPARGLDDYSGLMRELRELQRASNTLSGELARERHLRSPYR